MLDKKHILNRFISYVKIDTESDPKSTSTPSTLKQWDLANKLAEELKSIGMQDVSIDANAYIMASILFSNFFSESKTIFVGHHNIQYTQMKVGDCIFFNSFVTALHPN